MLYRCRVAHAEICVLRVQTDVLDLRGSVITDGNAASAYTAFHPAPRGLTAVDGDLVFAEFWTDPDPIRQYHKKRVKCAEVLVPERVEPGYIAGAYVSCADTQRTLRTVEPRLGVIVDAHLFFI
jgi:hypothetical protein